MGRRVVIEIECRQVGYPNAVLRLVSGRVEGADEVELRRLAGLLEADGVFLRRPELPLGEIDPRLSGTAIVTSLNPRGREMRFVVSGQPLLDGVPMERDVVLAG